MNELQHQLLSYCTDNVGDDIQSLAARQFLPKVDGYIDRDFRDGDHEPNRSSFLIANGWYSHEPGALVFPDHVQPFFIRVHIANETFITPNVISYLQRFAPIGCCDSAT